MAGNKNSGRHEKRSEVRVSELANLSVGWAIGYWDKFTVQQKIRILNVLAPRYIVQKVETEVDINEKNEITLTISKDEIEERMEQFMRESICKPN